MLANRIPAEMREPVRRMSSAGDCAQSTLPKRKNKTRNVVHEPGAVRTGRAAEGMAAVGCDNAILCENRQPQPRLSLSGVR